MDTTRSNLVEHDPILEELWAIKSQINSDANYSVDEIIRRLKIKYPNQVEAEVSAKPQ